MEASFESIPRRDTNATEWYLAGYVYWQELGIGFWQRFESICVQAAHPDPTFPLPLHSLRVFCTSWCQMLMVV
jgi:hypothetical protein